MQEKETKANKFLGNITRPEFIVDVHSYPPQRE